MNFHKEIQEKIEAKIEAKIIWEDFFSRHDLKWNKLPSKWEQCAYIGNGLIGASIYKHSDSILRWELGRTDVTAHYKLKNIDWMVPRVLIGDLFLKPKGKVFNKSNMKLDLWNAELNTQIFTMSGEIKIRSFVHSSQNIMIIDIETLYEENEATFELVPQHGISPRVYYQENVNIEDLELPIKPVKSKSGDVNLSTQEFLTGGECVIAWKEVHQSKCHRVIYLSIGHSYPEKTALNEAVKNVLDAEKIGLEQLVITHRQWWHEYYPKSFISIPDTRMESFYWIQMYKLASATRGEHKLLDILGPWMPKTPWPGIWCNLNIQLAYSPIYASNHLDIGMSLCRSLDKNTDNLKLNVPEEFRGDSAAIGRVCTYDLRSDTNIGWELGNLTYLCHNYWRQYRYSMDDEMCRNKLYPLLKLSINFYLSLLEEDNEGKFHLPYAISPEYDEECAGKKWVTRDSNYDLSLLRWGCQALLQICERLSICDEMVGKWEDVLNRLAPNPVDKNGFMVGRDLPFKWGHRHFSHMMSVFPLNIVNVEQEENLELIKGSLRHWLSFEDNLEGFTFTSAASIAAYLGLGNDSYDFLNILIDGYLKSNTMYMEAGPVIETPLAGAESIHDMLLQSWGGKIRIFPALPDQWKDVTFQNLRTEGAFLVSAVRRAGKTQFVNIKSLAGEKCIIKANLEGEYKYTAERTIDIKELYDGFIEIDLQKNEEIILYSGEEIPKLEIDPVEEDKMLCNYFGSYKPWRLYGIPYGKK